MPGWLAVANDQQNKSKSSFRTSATTNHKTMHVAYTFQEDRQNAEVENFIVADCSATTTKNKAIEKISCPGLSARLTMVYIKYGTRLNHAARGPRLLVLVERLPLSSPTTPLLHMRRTQDHINICKHLSRNSGVCFKCTGSFLCEENECSSPQHVHLSASISSTPVQSSTNVHNVCSISMYH